MLADLFDLVKVHDPDMILFPEGDLWVPRMVIQAKKYGLDQSLSRLKDEPFGSRPGRGYGAAGEMVGQADPFLYGLRKSHCFSVA